MLTVMCTVPSARWTHVALPSADLDASIEWYERFTPLRLLDRRSDADGEGAWLGQPEMVDSPFILVLVSFERDRADGPLGVLTPFAHLGIELPHRDDVDAVAALAERDGCLVWPPRLMPPPIGYICAARDPDGNVVEFSHDQGVYAKAREVWGS